MPLRCARFGIQAIENRSKTDLNPREKTICRFLAARQPVSTWGFASPPARANVEYSSRAAQFPRQGLRVARIGIVLLI